MTRDQQTTAINDRSEDAVIESLREAMGRCETSIEEDRLAAVITEIEALREVVRLLGIYPFSGSRDDPFVAAACQIGAPATPKMIAAVKRALHSGQRIAPSEVAQSGSTGEVTR